MITTVTVTVPSPEGFHPQLAAGPFSPAHLTAPREVARPGSQADAARLHHSKNVNFLLHIFQSLWTRYV